MNKKAQLDPCIRCHKIPEETDRFCTGCGAPLQNRCSDEPGLLKKGCTHLNPRSAAYCSKCGLPTTFKLYGLVEAQPRK
ncbi:hypothetical protein ERIC1_2c02230 [Paenibacillus larvae subsp. larvae DSM 25719]|uniref:DZANK-type domain-containing protein n=1 Tax=Paenibacillus larvae subsp. larvae DSM 25430 TaxID=697284 RepID=V9W869_9BACL|nr:hypothetical protein ERIC2_c14620 [Paenibacillus larvae subsp. larvae DSM 25430]ETK26029.1 hypothetical protein ERIC1_2c02230 [Paenibacillus larvae subsp. larvae DSM 25719]